MPKTNSKIQIFSSSTGGIPVKVNQERMQTMIMGVAGNDVKIEIIYIDLPEHSDKKQKLRDAGCIGKYPSLWVDDQFIGIFDDVMMKNEDGLLEEILKVED